VAKSRRNINRPIVTADAIQDLVRLLPRRRRWVFQETPLDYDFSAGVRGPEPLRQKSYDFPLEPGWLELLIFGEYDYAEGGGAQPFLGVERKNGVVYALDFERDQPLAILNSGLEAFVKTFEAIDAHLAKSSRLPRQIGETLQTIDPAVYESSDWKKFVGFVLDEES
jgi:hypothetical protein